MQLIGYQKLGGKKKQLIKLADLIALSGIQAGGKQRTGEGNKKKYYFTKTQNSHARKNILIT